MRALIVFSIYLLGCLLAVEPSSTVFAQGPPVEDPVVYVLRSKLADEIANLNAAQFDLWLFDGLTARAAQQYLETSGKLRISTLRNLCALSDAQVAKTELAVQADLRKFIEEGEEMRTKLEEALSDGAKLAVFVHDVQLFKLKFDRELCGDQSFFAKALPNVLTNEQLIVFRRAEIDRRSKAYLRRVVTVMDKLTLLLNLTADQRRRFTELIVAESPILPPCGPYDADVILWKISKLPETRLKEIIDTLQWITLNRQTSGFSGLAPFFKEGGLLPEGPLARKSEIPLPPAENSAAERKTPGQQQLPRAAKRAYGPEQAAGEPDTRRFGDIQTAWASATPDGQQEWLICHYANAVNPKAVLIRETFNPGAVTKISVFDADGKEVVAWEGVDPTPRDCQLGLSLIPLKVPFETRKIKITIDSPAVPGWNEIDAVGLRDDDGELQWAEKVEASSSFGQGQMAFGVGFGGEVVQAVVAAPAPVMQQLNQLTTEVRELRKELERLKHIETEIHDLKKLLEVRLKP